MEKRQKDDLGFFYTDANYLGSVGKGYFRCIFCFSVVIGFALFMSVSDLFYFKVNFCRILTIENKIDPVCSSVSTLDKFDCHPDIGASEQECLKRGCCYSVGNENFVESNFFAFPPLNVPYCYYPSNYEGYTLGKIKQDGRRVMVNLKRNIPSGFPDDIKNLHLVITFIDDNILRIKITDANQTRFEVPIPINVSLRNLNKPSYDVRLNSDSGQLTVSRKPSGTTIFSTDLRRLVYANQFLQLSSDLPSPYIYGIGEHYGSFLRNVNWTRITLLNSDTPPVPNYPLYGSQPFYFSLEEDGNANGVFLLNSNAMDVILQPKPAITFRPIGGILDFFIMLGPTPATVIQQYTSIVGRTFMPPYWSLGFHLCRFGYKTLNKTRETMERTIAYGIPLDVQWNDIDYMDKYKDFTYDKEEFAGLPEFVEDLHQKGMHYIIMTDPGISGNELPGTYPPYDEGLKNDLFIKNPNGSIFRGKVWTDGETVFPDFSNPNAESYWTKQFSEFYKQVKFDGVWIDMNEPSNFYDGRIDGCDKSSYEDPPYVPNGNFPLRHKTVCMTSKHFATIHYNEHNLYGYREATATNKALRTVRNKRPFIISRATFLGQGSQSGHWSGDVSSSWEDMRYSIPSLLNFNLYGISMIGSDICGFNHNTTVELCARWQALGAFYPFSRNHNERVTIEQDPVALGPIVIEAARNSLEIRYTLLPYLYTLFYRSHVYGDTVIRPLFFEYPMDKETYALDEQFFFGPAVMIIPALYPNVSSVTSYFPKGMWWNQMGLRIISYGKKITLPTPETAINVIMRAGFILPTLEPGMTTTESRKLPFNLIAFLDEKGKASGELYWDDGDSLDTYERGEYNVIQFDVKQNTLTNNIIKNGYITPMSVAFMRVYSNTSIVAKEVSVNDISCHRQTQRNKKENRKSIFVSPLSEIYITKSQEEISCGFMTENMALTVYIKPPLNLLLPLKVLWN